MNLAVVAPFPPGDEHPLCSFTFQAVSRFSTSGAIDEIVVLSPFSNDLPKVERHGAVEVRRCWLFDSVFALPQILFELCRVRPDVVWVNANYALFGTSLISGFLGLQLLRVLNAARVPAILTLHNYLAAVDVECVGVSLSPILKRLVDLADYWAMSSLMKAPAVMTMVAEYHRDLSQRYPEANVKLVGHDLYVTLGSQPSLNETPRALAFGYFGTCKRLEVLADAFPRVRESVPDAELIVAGRSHLRTPGYLDSFLERYGATLEGMTYIGYVPEAQLESVFHDSWIVVLTNRTVPGSSAVVQYAANYGRAILAPDIEEFRRLREDGWSIDLYQPDDPDSLSDALIGILSDRGRATTMGLANLQRYSESGDSFVRMHLREFSESCSADPTAKPMWPSLALLMTRAFNLGDSFLEPDDTQRS